MAYFDSSGGRRELLLWAIATRSHLEAHERLVAKDVAFHLYKAGPRPPRADIWQSQTARHMTLVSARNLVRAVELDANRDLGIQLPAQHREAIIETRDLVEHWDENMQVFNVRPRSTQPKYRSGKEFASKHANTSPYSTGSWTERGGVLLGPVVTGEWMHVFLDEVYATVLTDSPRLSDFVLPRAASPWLGSDANPGYEWWPPRPDDGSAILSTDDGVVDDAPG